MKHAMIAACVMISSIVCQAMSQVQRPGAGIPLFARSSQAFRLAPDHLTETVAIPFVVGERVTIQVQSFGALNAASLSFGGLPTSLLSPSLEGTVQVWHDGGAGISGSLPDLSPAPPDGYAYQWIGNAPGNATLTLQTNALAPENLVVVQTIYHDSVVAMGVIANSPQTPVGLDSYVTFAVLNGDDAIQGATVAVNVVSPAEVLTTIAALDDGQGEDAQANDGLYTCAIPMSAPGDYHLEGRATITVPNVGTVTRVAATTIRAHARTATFVRPGQVSVNTVDADANGYLEAIEVHAAVTVSTAGEFLFTARLSDDNGNSYLTAGGINALQAGTRTVVARLLSDDVNSVAAASEYELADLVLFKDNGSEWLDYLEIDNTTVDVPPVTGFEGPPLEVIDLVSEDCVDQNSTPGCEIFTCTLEAISRNIEGYHAYGVLSVCGHEIDNAFGYGGILNDTLGGLLSFDFDGVKIGRVGVNGPWQLDVWLIPKTEVLSGTIDVTDFFRQVASVGTCQDCYASEYEGFRRNNPAMCDMWRVMHQPWIDLNGDWVPDDRCPADIVGTTGQHSAPDGMVSIEDAAVFVSEYANAGLSADLAGTATSQYLPDGVVNDLDTAAFLRAVQTTCPPTGATGTASSPVDSDAYNMFGGNDPRIVTRWNAQSPVCELTPQYVGVTFVGPIAILPRNPNGMGPLSIQYHAWLDADLNGVADPDPEWWEVSARLQFSIDPSNASRLLLKPKSGVTFPPGTYRVTSWPSPADQRLLYTVPSSSLIAPAQMTVAAQTEYYFTVYADCSPLDCAADCPQDELQLCCGYAVPSFVCDDIDFNGDGLFPDTLDVDDFQSVFSGGPCSTGTCWDLDYNNDGLFPDTLDLDALLSVMSGGPCLL